LPYFNIYSATKAFGDFLSRSLAEEYPNIDIMSLRPGYVSTQLNARKKPSLEVLTPEECAEGCLKDLGKRKFTFGNWRHKVQGSVLHLVPDPIFYKVWTNNLGLKIVKERAKKH